MMKKSSVITGAAVLFAANIVVKITGVIFKIPVQRIIGDTGMGYFNVAYSIYIWFYLICTAGLPVAVSICVARAAAEENHGKCDSARDLIIESLLIFESSFPDFLASSAHNLVLPCCLLPPASEI